MRKCHAGCATSPELMAEARKRSLLPDAAKRRQGKIVTTYDYTDREGKLLFQVVRTKPKGFWQRIPDGKVGWTYVFTDSDGSSGALTGPLLTDFSANTCWNDAFDLWVRPDEFGTCAGVFFFSGCNPPTAFGVPQPCVSFWLKAWEDDGSDLGSHTVVPYACNLSSFANVVDPAIGATWESSVIVDPIGKGQLISIVRLTASFPSAIPPPLGFPFFDFGTGAAGCGGSSSLAIMAPFLSPPSVVVSGAAIHAHSVGVVKQLGQVGLRFHAQAFAVAVGPLTIEAFNRIDILIGAQP